MAHPVKIKTQNRFVHGDLLVEFIARLCYVVNEIEHLQRGCRGGIETPPGKTPPTLAIAPFRGQHWGQALSSLAVCQTMPLTAPCSFSSLAISSFTTAQARVISV